MTLSCLELRQRLGLSRSHWARALGIHERTVLRWEEGSADPGGLAVAIMRGIENALDRGADGQAIGRVISLGIDSLVYHRLVEDTAMFKRRSKART